MADGTVVLNYRLFANTQQNVLVFSNMPTTPEGRQTMADAMRASFIVADLPSNRSNNWSWVSVTFIYNDQLPIFSVEVPFTAGALFGLSASDTLAPQTSLLVSTKIVGTPPNRGRIYFGGLTENDNTDLGQWDAGTLANHSDWVSSLVDGVPYTGGAGMAFLRIGRRNAAGVLTLTNGIETVVAQAVPAIQRRRRQGVGI